MIAERKWYWSRAVGLAALVLGFTLCNSLAQANMVPDGGETLLNITTAGNQNNPSYTYSPNGLHRVAVWQSYGQDGDGYGVFARFGGVSVEIPVNETTSGWQGSPDVSVSNAGSTVIVWGSDDPDDDSIFARIFDNAGGPLTGEFLVETLPGQHQLARVDHFPNGNFVVVWNPSDNGETMMKFFDPAGNALTSHILTSPHYQSGADVSVGPNDFGIVTWRVSSGADEGSYYRLFDPSGNWITAAMLASQTTGDHFYGTAASSTIGAAFVSWIVLNADETSTLFTRAIDPNGTPLTPETEVATITASSIIGLTMSHDSGGRGALVWGQVDPSPGDVWIQCLSNGDAVGGPEIVNTSASERQRTGSVCHDNLGGLTVSWYTDSGDDDCFTQKYDLGSAASTESGFDLGNSSPLSTRGFPTVFAGETNLVYHIGAPSSVEAAIVDVLGRRIRTLGRGAIEAGEHQLRWDGRDDSGRRVAAGTYWFLARAGRDQSSTRLVLVR